MRVSGWSSRHGPLKGKVHRLLVLSPFSGLDPGHRQKGPSLLLSICSLALEKEAFTQHLQAGHRELPCDPKSYRFQILCDFRRDPSWLLTMSVTLGNMYHLSETFSAWNMGEGMFILQGCWEHSITQGRQSSEQCQARRHANQNGYQESTFSGACINMGSVAMLSGFRPLLGGIRQAT